jgi:hypothetical protein
MAPPTSVAYIEVKARINRSTKRMTTFLQASADYNQDRSSVGKRAKLSQMFSELNILRENVENDI